MSFTLNMVEHELEPFGRIVRSLAENPVLGEVRHYLNAATSDGPATLYVCDNEVDVLAANQAGCYAVYVSPDAHEPAEGAVLSVLEGETPSIVFDALLDIARRFGEWEHDMDMLRLSGGSLQSLVDLSEPFLLNNVVVLDPALKLLAYTKGMPCDDPITVELIEHGYHTEENIAKFKLNKRFKSWAEDEGFVINDTRTICKYTTIVKSFKARSSFSLITVMMCNNEASLDYLVDVFGMFTERVEYYAMRDYPDDKPSGIAVDAFLRDLIDGTLSESAVAERSQYVGIPATGRFCLFYLKPGEGTVPVPRVLSDVSLAVAPAKTVLVNDAITVLCFNCAHDRKTLHFAPETCPRAHRTNSERLNSLLERYDLTCGRSSKFTSLSKTATAFAQAREAFAASKRPDVHERGMAANAWSRIFSFDRFGIDYLASQLSPETIELMNSMYAGTIIDNIARQDAVSHTNNYEFLHAYLVYERRITVVAEKLHMHRNNVSYRIGRIEDQFGISTADPQLRQDLLLAYRIREAAAASSGSSKRKPPGM